MTVLIDLGSNSTLFREGASVLSAKFLPFARLDVSQSLFQLHKKHSGKFCSKPCFQASQKKPANSRLMLSWVELPLRRHWLCWRRPWHFFNTHDQTQLQKPAIHRHPPVCRRVCLHPRKSATRTYPALPKTKNSHSLTRQAKKPSVPNSELLSISNMIASRSCKGYAAQRWALRLPRQ
jgi:hypothetical protein